MKRLVTVLILILVTAGAVFAQFDDPFMPANPIVMGQGGSFVANAEGYNAFFHNPAGFARDGEFTLTSINVWGFIDRKLLDFALQILEQGGLGSTGPSAAVVSRSLTSRQTSDQTLLQELLGDDYQTLADTLGADAVAELDDTITGIADWSEANADDLDAVLEATLNDPDVQAALAGNDVLTTLSSGGEIAPEDLIGLLGSGLDTLSVVVDAFVAQAENVTGSAPQTASGQPITGDSLTQVFENALPGGTIRLGGMVGLASWVGNGVGFGIFANAATNITGQTILNARGRAFLNLTGVFGLGFNFGNLSIGAAIRPGLLGYTEINPSSLIGDILGTSSGGGEFTIDTLFNEGIFYGATAGLDVGALYDLGPFTFGASIKDLIRIGPDYSRLTISDFETISGPQDVITILEQGGEPVPSGFQPWIPPINLSVGAQFHPDLGVLSFLIDPRVSVDVVDMFEFIRILSLPESDPRRVDWSILDMLHIGAEVTVLQLASVRAGIYGEFLSAGVGLNLLFMDVNVAVSGDFDQVALARGQLEFGTIGVGVEAAIRF